MDAKVRFSQKLLGQRFEIAYITGLGGVRCEITFAARFSYDRKAKLRRDLGYVCVRNERVTTRTRDSDSLSDVQRYILVEDAIDHLRGGACQVKQGLQSIIVLGDQR